jgi:ribose 1,5-bisphosphokinase
MENAIRPTKGRLFYVVGASGVGKDSLMQYARETLDKTHPIVFAHRYITRPAKAGGENHIALSECEFALRERHSLFAMDWQSHGFRYAIGIEIDAWLAKGMTVVVNGSRAYTQKARERYPVMHVVWISARPQVLATRLVRRGRESQAEIAARLERNSRIEVELPSSALHISNDGVLESAGSRLIALLAGHNPL